MVRRVRSAGPSALALVFIGMAITAILTIAVDHRFAVLAVVLWLGCAYSLAGLRRPHCGWPITKKELRIGGAALPYWGPTGVLLVPKKCFMCGQIFE
jgi:hypothetical protein